MGDDLVPFLREARDAREYQRAQAVKLALDGYRYAQIAAIMQVSPSFISKWKRIYLADGIAALRLGYGGTQGYLTTEQRAQTIAWLQAQEQWDVAALQTYLRTTFAVAYQSLQSYYDLLSAAGLSWKKAEATNPKKTLRRWRPNRQN